MSFGDYITIATLALFALAAGMYAWELNLPKLMYFGGAFILTLGVLWME